MFRAAGVALLRGGSSTVRNSATKKAPKERKPDTNRGANLANRYPLSVALAEFMGVKEATRQDATSKVWKYIRENNLQNPNKKTEYRTDAKLKKILPEEVVSFGTISQLLSKHFPPSVSAKKPKAVKGKKAGIAEQAVPA